MTSNNTVSLPKTLWGFYARYAIRPFRVLSIIYLLGLGSAWIIMEIFRPLLERYFYGLFDNGLSDDFMVKVAMIAAMCIGAAHLGWHTLGGIAELAGNRWRIKSQYKIIETLSQYLESQSVKFHRDLMPGKTHEFVYNIVDGIKWRSLVQINAMAVIILVNCGLLFSTNRVFAYITLGYCIFQILYILFVVKKIKAYSKINTEHAATYSANLLDFIENITISKLFDVKLANSNILAQAKENHIKYTIRSADIMWTAGGIPSYVRIFVQIAFMLLSVFFFARGQMTLPEIIWAYTILRVFGHFVTEATMQMPETVNSFIKANYSYHQLVMPIEITDSPNATNLKVKSGRIEFKNVSFGYNRKKVIKNLNLVIRPHEKVGIVGISGSGKTTLINLLMRFYDCDSGQILVDNTNIKTITQASLHRAFSLIPQDITMFNRTLAENIGYGAANSTITEIQAAARMANADKFINEFPKKYETIVGDRGIKLSGGQRQRIAIARAFLKNAPVLIMDEATSALDSESESKIQQSLQKLARGRTTIVIAHRLATLKSMDRIIVLDKGKIAESGTHAALIKKRNGLYKKLWQQQNLV